MFSCRSSLFTMIVIHVHFCIYIFSSASFCKKWIFFVYKKNKQFYVRNHNLVNRYGISVLQMITDMFLSSFMTHQRVCNKSNTTGIICGARTVYTRTEHMNSPLVFSGVRVAQFLIFRLVFCI